MRRDETVDTSDRVIFAGTIAAHESEGCRRGAGREEQQRETRDGVPLHAFHIPSESVVEWKYL
jgi:hypothetical protein